MGVLAFSVIFILLIVHSHVALKHCHEEDGNIMNYSMSIISNCMKKYGVKNNSSEISSRSSWGDRRNNQYQDMNQGPRDDRSEWRSDSRMQYDARVSWMLPNPLEHDPYRYQENSRYDNYNNYYRPSTPSSKRYKRSPKMELNSGHRSQYNPNTHRGMYYQDNYKQPEKDSHENNNDTIDACVLHCILEDMGATNSDGYPDKYLVIDMFTKDKKDKEFINYFQESINDCYKIVYNDHIDDKCKFTEILLTCIEEKGKAFCDNWDF